MYLWPLCVWDGCQKKMASIHPYNHLLSIPDQPLCSVTGGYSLSQLTLGNRQVTSWTSIQSITSLPTHTDNSIIIILMSYHNFEFSVQLACLLILGENWKTRGNPCRHKGNKQKCLIFKFSLRVCSLFMVIVTILFFCWTCNIQDNIWQGRSDSHHLFTPTENSFDQQSSQTTSTKFLYLEFT